MFKKLWLLGALAVVVLGIVLHSFLLTALGEIVVYENADFKQVDAVVVLSGGVPDRALQARDLLLNSKAKVAFLTQEVLSKQERLLENLGFHVPQSAEINRKVLVRAGIDPDRIIDLPGKCDSTKDEADALKRYLRDHPLKSIALTTCKNHSYRAYLNFKRALGDNNVQIYSVPSRYCEYKPDGWWKNRDQIKTLYVEFASLIAYFFGRA